MTPTDIKDRIRTHMDEAGSILRPTDAFEQNYFHDYFRRMPFVAMQRLLQQSGVNLAGKSVHLAGCGFGIDLYHLSRMYPMAQFFATDISSGAVARTLEVFPGVNGQAEDLEHLSFADNTFDWSFIAASIHHLPRPVLGVYELLRVSREGLIFIEPADSWLVRSFVSLKLAQEYEEHGNYVYRWSKHDIKQLCCSLYYEYRCATMFATHRVAKTRIEFEVLRGLNRIANLLMGSAGNYMLCCILKGPRGEARLAAE